MRTIVNLLSTLKPKTGIGHYAARLFSALCRYHPDVGVHAFPTGATEALVRRAHAAWPQRGPGTINGPRPAFAAVAARLKGALRAAGAGSLGLAFRAACRRGGFDLYHEPNFIAFECPLPTVVTVADLSVILHPEWHPTDRVRFHERCFRQGLGGDRHIITISEVVRREVIAHLGVAPECVTAVPLGVSSEFFDVSPVSVSAARAALCLPATYLLYVGTIEPRKNLMTLLRAYCALPGDLRTRCPLVVAGGWGWKSETVADYYRQTAAARNVIQLGYVDDCHVLGLYAGARALVSPSFYEGFGLPPLEMLACGGAVIASTAEAHREVLGRHAHFVDPHDEAGWHVALAKAIRDDVWLAEIRQGGRQRARRFSWEACAAGTAAVYRSVIAPPLRRAA